MPTDSSKGQTPVYKSQLEQHVSALLAKQARLDLTVGERASANQTLGGVYMELGKYDDALENYGTALEALESEYGKKHFKVAQALNNMGTVY